MAAATRFWIVNSSSMSSPRAADDSSAGSSWSRRSSASAAIRSGETAREGGAAASELMFALYRNRSHQDSPGRQVIADTLDRSAWTAIAAEHPAPEHNDMP